jgi:hypothetical protein
MAVVIPRFPFRILAWSEPVCFDDGDNRHRPWLQPISPMTHVKHLAYVSHALKPPDVGICSMHKVDLPLQHNALDFIVIEALRLSRPWVLLCRY